MALVQPAPASNVSSQLLSQANGGLGEGLCVNRLGL